MNREYRRRIHAPSSRHYRKGHVEHCQVVAFWAKFINDTVREARKSGHVVRRTARRVR